MRSSFIVILSTPELAVAAILARATETAFSEIGTNVKVLLLATVDCDGITGTGMLKALQMAVTLFTKYSFIVSADFVAAAKVLAG